jgi:hypothetical protein
MNFKLKRLQTGNGSAPHCNSPNDINNPTSCLVKTPMLIILRVTCWTFRHPLSLSKIPSYFLLSQSPLTPAGVWPGSLLF